MEDEYVITVDSLDFQWHADCLEMCKRGAELVMELEDNGYSSPATVAFIDSVRRVSDRVNA
jgi:hypothetical protein